MANNTITTKSEEGPLLPLVLGFHLSVAPLLTPSPFHSHCSSSNRSLSPSFRFALQRSPRQIPPPRAQVPSSLGLVQNTFGPLSLGDNSLTEGILRGGTESQNAQSLAHSMFGLWTMNPLSTAPNKIFGIF